MGARRRLRIVIRATRACRPSRVPVINSVRDLLDLLVAVAIVVALLGLLLREEVTIVDGPFTGTQTLTGSVTTGSDFLRLDKDYLSWTGHGITVYGSNGEVAYHVENSAKFLSLRCRQTLSDPVSGKPIAVVQKKLLCLRSTYEIFRWTPAYKGQEPAEKDDRAAQLPLYRYAWVEKSLFSLLDTYIYSLQTADSADPMPALKLTSNTVLYPITQYGGSDAVIGTIGHSTPYALLLREHAISRLRSFVISVGAGMDLPGMLTFALAIHNIEEGIQRKKDAEKRSG